MAEGITEGRPSNFTRSYGGQSERRKVKPPLPPRSAPRPLPPPPRPPTEKDSTDSKMDRRSFLKKAGIFIGGGLFGAAADRIFGPKQPVPGKASTEVPTSTSVPTKPIVEAPTSTPVLTKTPVETPTPLPKTEAPAETVFNPEEEASLEELRQVCRKSLEAFMTEYPDLLQIDDKERLSFDMNLAPDFFGEVHHKAGNAIGMVTTAGDEPMTVLMTSRESEIDIFQMSESSTRILVNSWGGNNEIKRPEDVFYNPEMFEQLLMKDLSLKLSPENFETAVLFGAFLADNWGKLSKESDNKKLLHSGDFLVSPIGMSYVYLLSHIDGMLVDSGAGETSAFLETLRAFAKAKDLGEVSGPGLYDPRNEYKFMTK